MMSIASKSPTEEKITFSLARRQNVIKTTNEKKDKETFDMDGIQRMIQKLTNDIVDLKKNSGESSSYRRPWKTSFRRNPPPPNNPNTSPEEIHIEEFSQDHYCRAHETNHYEKNCPTFINMFKVFVAMEEDKEGQTSQEEKRDDHNIESSINVIWDITHGIIDDE
jgi:hypothetical protein